MPVRDCEVRQQEAQRELGDAPGPRMPPQACEGATRERARRGGQPTYRRQARRAERKQNADEE
jgi:hypothetical protein